MSANETYIHKLRSELNNNNKPEVVSFYIENIPLIAYIIDRIKSLFYIRKSLQSGILDFFNPLLNGCFSFRMTFGK